MKRSKDRKPSLLSLRRSGRCQRYQLMLSERDLPTFPTKHVDASSFDYLSFLEAGFDVPFIVDGYSERFGVRIPSKSETGMQYIADKVGKDTQVRIIEVGEQAELFGYTIQQYADLLNQHDPAGLGSETKILNMISLEFSGTSLAAEVNSPDFVNRIDWVRCIWPMERMSRGDYPHVQKYCLAGMAGSYTDFHVDFGGTSVWYHILRGAKRFFLIPPTTRNLLMYQQWTTSTTQSSTFLGDLCPGECFALDLRPGETLLLPSGWIHSVFTPEDSIVFGGNFLHSYSICRQLQAFEIECATRVGKSYMFPQFKQIHWYFLVELLQIAQQLYAQPPGSVQTIEDDDYNIMQLICQHLFRPAVLRQLPLLVSKCAQWAAIDRLAPVSEFKGCGTPMERERVVNEWWQLLLRIADHAAYRGGSVDVALAQSFKAHIEHIRQLGEESKMGVDLFAEDVVESVLPDFAADVSRIAEQAASLPLLPRIPKPEPVETPQKSTASEDTLHHNSQATRNRREVRSSRLGLLVGASDDDEFGQEQDADFVNNGGDDSYDEYDDGDEDGDGELTWQERKRRKLPTHAKRGQISATSPSAVRKSTAQRSKEAAAVAKKPAKLSAQEIIWRKTTKRR